MKKEADLDHVSIVDVCRSSNQLDVTNRLQQLQALQQARAEHEQESALRTEMGYQKGSHKHAKASQQAGSDDQVGYQLSKLYQGMGH